MKRKWEKVDNSVDSVDKSEINKEANIFCKTMLIGEYQHTIDQKNRLSIPSKFRKELGRQVIVTRGLDNCLFLYPIAEWTALAEKLARLPWGKADTRSFIRTMIAGAIDVEIDSLGRILLPDYLKLYGELADRAVVVGLYNRVEIWNPELWKVYSTGAQKNAEVVAEKLGELGLY